MVSQGGGGKGEGQKGEEGRRCREGEREELRGEEMGGRVGGEERKRGKRGEREK